MTAEDLKRVEEIEELMGKIKTGPWHWELIDDQVVELCGPDPEHDFVLWCERCEHCAKRDADCVWPNRDHREFISKSPENIDFLLGLVRKLLDNIDEILLDAEKIKKDRDDLAHANTALGEQTASFHRERDVLAGALERAADEFYGSAVADSGLDEFIIGEGKQYASKEDFIKNIISEWKWPRDPEP